jgi:hypothetical protein
MNKNLYNLKKPKKTRKAVERFWLTFFVSDSGYCSLCGNTGFIDTTETASTPTGLNVGRRNLCICPNGQAIRFDQFQ